MEKGKEKKTKIVLKTSDKKRPILNKQINRVLHNKV
jgi:hypothetical protein